jgi:hypothetical protein
MRWQLTVVEGTLQGYNSNCSETFRQHVPLTLLRSVRLSDICNYRRNTHRPCRKAVITKIISPSCHKVKSLGFFYPALQAGHVNGPARFLPPAAKIFIAERPYGAAIINCRLISCSPPPGLLQAEQDPCAGHTGLPGCDWPTAVY